MTSPGHISLLEPLPLMLTIIRTGHFNPHAHVFRGVGGIACHDMIASEVSIEQTSGAFMLTWILLGDGSIACHDITVS